MPLYYIVFVAVGELVIHDLTGINVHSRDLICMPSDCHMQFPKYNFVYASCVWSEMFS